MKENFKGLISRLDIADAGISKPRGRSIENFQIEINRRNNEWKQNQNRSVYPRAVGQYQRF